MSTSVRVVSLIGAFSLCECAMCCCWELDAGASGVSVVDDRRRSVETYGLPHQATSVVDTPDVASVVDGRDNSTMKMHGESEPASVREDREYLEAVERLR
jgi:hypothetical protein